jgi:hypothetical protein
MTASSDTATTSPGQRRGILGVRVARIRTSRPTLRAKSRARVNGRSAPGEVTSRVYAPGTIGRARRARHRGGARPSRSCRCRGRRRRRGRGVGRHPHEPAALRARDRDVEDLDPEVAGDRLGEVHGRARAAGPRRSSPWRLLASSSVGRPRAASRRTAGPVRGRPPRGRPLSGSPRVGPSVGGPHPGPGPNGAQRATGPPRATTDRSTARRSPPRARAPRTGGRRLVGIAHGRSVPAGQATTGRSLAPLRADLLGHLGGVVDQGLDDVLLADGRDLHALLDDVALAVAGGDPEVGLAGLPGAVDHAAHDRDPQRRVDALEALLDVLGEGPHVDLGASARGARHHVEAPLAQVERLEDRDARP